MLSNGRALSLLLRCWVLPCVLLLTDDVGSTHTASQVLDFMDAADEYLLKSPGNAMGTRASTSFLDHISRVLQHCGPSSRGVRRALLGGHAYGMLIGACNPTFTCRPDQEPAARRDGGRDAGERSLPVFCSAFPTRLSHLYSGFPSPTLLSSHVLDEATRRALRCTKTPKRAHRLNSEIDLLGGWLVGGHRARSGCGQPRAPWIRAATSKSFWTGLFFFFLFDEIIPRTQRL